MRKSSLALSAVLGAAIMMSGSISAYAQTITVGPITTTTPIPTQKTDFSGILSFPEFDGSLGTLQSVGISFTSKLQTQLTVQNSASSVSSGTAFTQLSVGLSDPGNYLPNPPFDSGGNAVDGAFTGVNMSAGYNYSLLPGNSVTSGVLAHSATTSMLFDSTNYASLVNEFVGPGTIDFSALTVTKTLLNNTGGNTSATQSTYASLTGTVTYTYTPRVVTGVPEPTAIALLGTGLLGGLTAVRRRRRAA